MLTSLIFVLSISDDSCQLSVNVYIVKFKYILMHLPKLTNKQQSSVKLWRMEDQTSATWRTGWVSCRTSRATSPLFTSRCQVFPFCPHTEPHNRPVSIRRLARQHVLQNQFEFRGVTRRGAATAAAPLPGAPASIRHVQVVENAKIHRHRTAQSRHTLFRLEIGHKKGVRYDLFRPRVVFLLRWWGAARN